MIQCTEHKWVLYKLIKQTWLTLIRAIQRRSFDISYFWIEHLLFRPIIDTCQPDFWISLLCIKYWYLWSLIWSIVSLIYDRTYLNLSALWLELFVILSILLSFQEGFWVSLLQDTLFEWVLFRAKLWVDFLDNNLFDFVNKIDLDLIIIWRIWKLL
jgi:hypothetical protein